MSDPAEPPLFPPCLPEEEAQARGFERQRQRRQAEVAEDYCELIADLIEVGGEARAVDIARRLGVSHATVVNTVSRLQRDGYVVSQPYRSIFLTDCGRQLAQTCRRRHVIIMRFLEALGIDAETARTDAEGIEHHVSEPTLAAFEKFLAGRAAP